MTERGRLEAIWIKQSHKGPMDPVDRTTLDPAGGISGNADYGSERQVTLVEREIWDGIRDDLDESIHPVMRRANLLVAGIPLANSSGRVLQVGSCRIVVRGETKPCHRIDDAYPGLQAALATNWGAGAWGIVLSGGEIKVGDVMKWEEETVEDGEGW
jgi:MOSC domain-containing protein YiiM